jgi:hypothetical protein
MDEPAAPKNQKDELELEKLRNEITKLQMEVAKINVEIPKLEKESRWRKTMMRRSYLRRRCWSQQS